MADDGGDRRFGLRASICPDKFESVSSAFDIPGRIKCGTVTTPAFDAGLEDYAGLGLVVAERGTVAAGLAASWGAPGCAGARTALLAAAGGRPCFVRLIEAPAVAGYRPLRSFGWGAYELTVADCFALHASLPAGFEVLGAPRQVAGFDNFIPFQVAGRGGEVLYLNQVLKGSMAGLDLPLTTARVDQIFIAVLGVPDRAAAVAFHCGLGFEAGETWTIPYGVINASFGLAPDTLTAMTMTRTGRLPGCEIDQYPAAAVARRVAAGQLPPGNAMVSFIHGDLDRVTAGFLAPPARRDGLLYGGRRTATLRGTAGELIELIEAGES